MVWESAVKGSDEPVEKRHFILAERDGRIKKHGRVHNIATAYI